MVSRPQAMVIESRFLLENSNEARELVHKGGFGTEQKDGTVELSIVEALYLLEKKKITVRDGRNKKLAFADLLRRTNKRGSKVWEKYNVFANLRDRGYIVKTALKFGADFRVYDRGVKPGQDHAKWLVYAVKEKDTQTWYDFSAKNRVAHSTRKKLLIGVVDDEGDVSYWECGWVRP